MKPMKVGDLRKALRGVPDHLSITVRACEETPDGDISLTSWLLSAEVQCAHDEDDTAYFALDSGSDYEDDIVEVGARV